MANGDAAVILRRLDALKQAIDAVTTGSPPSASEVAALEFSYDQTRSAVERHLGTRQRAYDPPRHTLTLDDQPVAEWTEG